MQAIIIRVMVGFAIFGFAVNSNVPLAPHTNVYGDYAFEEVTIADTHNVTIPKDEFLMLMAASVPDCPRFRFLEQYSGETVTLTPEDLMVLFCFAGQPTQEEIEKTKESYRGQTIELSYSPPSSKDAGPRLSMAAWRTPPT